MLLADAMANSGRMTCIFMGSADYNSKPGLRLSFNCKNQLGEGHAALIHQDLAATSSTADRACKQSNS